MRLALLSNVTLDVLAGLLRPRHEVWLAPGFDAWMPTALEPPKDLRDFAPEAVFFLLDRSGSAAAEPARAAAVAALERALPQAGVFVLDLNDLEDVTENFRDERMWSLAKMPWSLAGLKAIAGEIERLLASLREPPRKVLALDLDDTLWDGVVGEEGPQGVVPHAARQHAAVALRRRGVLLVALSHNNPDDVAPLWDDPRMVLSRDDFADLRLGWDEKARMLEACAAQLNLGTDAFVFVDDDPVEREKMRRTHPEVAVPEEWDNLRRVARLYFPGGRITSEDRDRTRLYADAARRAAAQAALPTLEEWLAALEQQVDVHPIREDEFVRVAQLSQKTNQFNVCTNRYSPAEIADWARRTDALVLSVRAGDRFGDLGLVSFVLARADGAAAEIVDWAMSCRAMNRRIEDRIAAELARHLAARGVTHLAATWRRTAKNAPVAELFDRLGFTRTAEEADVHRYARTLAK